MKLKKIKVKEIKLFQVTCPNPDCNRTFKTEKEKDIQCFGCGNRFDLPTGFEK